MSRYPYYDAYEICSNLKFSKMQIYIAAEAIKNFVKELNQIESVELMEEVSFIDVGINGASINLVIRPGEKLKKEIENHVLSSEHPFWEDVDEDTERAQDIINFIFDQYTRDDYIDDCWYLEKHGKALCGQHYLDILKEKASYDSCTCPKEYKSFCKAITNIMKKTASMKTEDILDKIYSS